jgi:Domain of unknown function (DUF4157)
MTGGATQRLQAGMLSRGQADTGPEPLIRRRIAVWHNDPDAAPNGVHDALRAPGEPLEVGLRQKMEAAFHADFSSVRVHTDERAARSALSVNAMAYASGRDIVFSPGRFSPHSGEGQRLLAHELAHVVQDGGRTAALPQQIASRESRAESRADSLASAAMRGSAATHERGKGSLPVLHRQAADRYAAARERIIGLGEARDAASRQQALDLILSTYYERPANLEGIVYDPNMEPKDDRPQDANTGPAPGQPSYGGRQRLTIGPRFFKRLGSRFKQHVRTIGHELQHVDQRSPAGGRTVGSTFAGIGLGAGIGLAAAGIGLSTAAGAGATLSAGPIGGVLAGAGALGGLIGGLADPFGSSAEPIRNVNTREFLAMHWTITAPVRGLGPLPPGQILQTINQPGRGILERWANMPAEDQQRYGRQHEEVLAIERRLEGGEATAPAAAAPAGAH